MDDITLDSLVGLHVLTGVDLSVEKVSATDDANVVRFILDGIAYTAMEDPKDGYRSSMEALSVGGEVKNTFKPHPVVAVKRADDSAEKNDILDLIDVTTGKIVLSVGTANTEDYYPYFVGEWTPENLAVNA